MKFNNGTFTASIAGLFNKGLRFPTVIDIGAADGNFFVDHFDAGFFPNAVPLNIDANPIYEDSLRNIKDVLGGEYLIAAISDAPGEIEFTNSVHPYWSSIRPPSDPYWTRINNLHSEVRKVQAFTLDGVIEAKKLNGPFLLKMDVQGAEENVLKGARETLRQTDAVIVEADIDDFQKINTALVAADFSLYDLTQLVWIEGGALGWFYPVYLNNRHENLKASAFWAKGQDDAVIKMQVERRKALLGSNNLKLSKFRAMFPKK